MHGDCLDVVETYGYEAQRVLRKQLFFQVVESAEVE